MLLQLRIDAASAPNAGRKNGRLKPAFELPEQKSEV
jgi:hypothetical protein